MRLIGLAVVLSLSFAAPVPAEAQPAGKVWRVGVLAGGPFVASRPWNTFREGLRELGYVEGQNVEIEWQATQGKAERLPVLAAELVRLKVDVIVAVDNPGITAAREATRTIPLVMVLATDPVGSGFVASLARPGGNITGLTLQATEWQGKAVQLLKEAIPHATRLVILWDPTEPGRRAQAREAEVAAPTLGLQVQLVGPRSPAELDGIFAAIARERTDIILVQPSQMIFAQRQRIAELAAKRLLPTIAWRREMVEAGVLMSYGPEYLHLFRRAASYVDKILRGTKVADLPVEQPTKFELVINLKTAKALGITIPQSVLVRADELIQ